MDIFEVIEIFIAIFEAIIPFLMALAVVIFLYGVVRYITAGGDAEKERQGRRAIMYGIIGLFVFIAFWGLVEVIVQTFDVGQSTSYTMPTTGPDGGSVAPGGAP